MPLRITLGRGRVGRVRRVVVVDIEPRVRSIMKSDRYTKLTVERQRALKTFLDTVDVKTARD